jgi:hypothetical protein
VESVDVARFAVLRERAGLGCAGAAGCPASAFERFVAIR